MQWVSVSPLEELTAQREASVSESHMSKTTQRPLGHGKGMNNTGLAHSPARKNDRQSRALSFLLDHSALCPLIFEFFSFSYLYLNINKPINKWTQLLYYKHAVVHISLRKLLFQAWHISFSSFSYLLITFTCYESIFY